MKLLRTLLALAVAGCVTTATAVAHHSFSAEYDAKQPITLKGTVIKMEWINPHSWIHINVKNPDGTPTEWMIESGTPNTLVRRGFTKPRCSRAPRSPSKVSCEERRQPRQRR
jgi:hypothetical protein